MSREDFMARFGVELSHQPFPPDRLFAPRRVPTRDTTRLSAIAFEHYRFASPPRFPAILVAHTLQERTGEVISFAERHRCKTEMFPSWIKQHLVAVAILRRESTTTATKELNRWQ